MTLPSSKPARQRGRALPRRRLGPFYLGLAAAALIGLAVIVSTALRSSPPPREAIPQTAATIPVGRTADGFWFKGAADAPVTLIVYSDYECPYCQRFEAALAATDLESRFIATGKVRLVYHEVPLVGLHPQAQFAAEVGRCAGDQGAFWPVHDALFAQQATWAGAADPPARILAIAAGAGANADEIRACFDAATHRPAISDAANAAFQAGIQGTPTVMVNGTVLRFRQDYGREVIAAIEAALAAAP